MWSREELEIFWKNLCNLCTLSLKQKFPFGYVAWWFNTKINWMIYLDDALIVKPHLLFFHGYKLWSSPNIVILICIHVSLMSRVPPTRQFPIWWSFKKKWKWKMNYHRWFKVYSKDIIQYIFKHVVALSLLVK